jgi:hypothetical protein
MNDTPTPETDGMTFFAQPGMMPPYNTVSSEFARKLERERDAALAANAELFERLQEARESHLIATARKVQTIQQQAVEIDRLKSVLADIYSLSRS